METEQEFLAHKHAASEAQMRSEAEAEAAAEELKGLREANAELEAAKAAMGEDLQAALSELSETRARHEDVKEQLWAEKQRAISRFKLWEQELTDKSSEVEVSKQAVRKSSMRGDVGMASGQLRAVRRWARDKSEGAGRRPRASRLHARAAIWHVQAGPASYRMMLPCPPPSGSMLM